MLRAGQLLDSARSRASSARHVPWSAPYQAHARTVLSARRLVRVRPGVGPGVGHVSEDNCKGLVMWTESAVRRVGRLGANGED